MIDDAILEAVRDEMALPDHLSTVIDQRDHYRRLWLAAMERYSDLFGRYDAAMAEIERRRGEAR